MFTQNAKCKEIHWWFKNKSIYMFIIVYVLQINQVNYALLYLVTFKFFKQKKNQLYYLMEIPLFVKLSSNKITLKRKKLNRKMLLKINMKNWRGVWAIIYKVKASIPNFLYQIFKLYSFFFNLRKNEWRKHVNIFSHSLHTFTLIFIFFLN